MTDIIFGNVCMSLISVFYLQYRKYGGKLSSFSGGNFVSENDMAVKSRIQTCEDKWFHKTFPILFWQFRILVLYDPSNRLYKETKNSVWTWRKPSLYQWIELSQWRRYPIDEIVGSWRSSGLIPRARRWLLEPTPKRQPRICFTPLF